MRSLGLATVWAQLEALSARMRRIEQDVQLLQLGRLDRVSQEIDGNLRVLRGQTIPAPGGAPPPKKGDA